MNVGATSPEDYGNYYAWGETEPNSNNYATWLSTKYNDKKTTLEAEDDAASVNWGGTWRMPTHTEHMELVNNCYWVWTSSYNGTGKAGYIVYKAKSSSDKGQLVKSGKTPSSSYSLSDSHIFLPAAGCPSDGGYNIAGEAGGYWSSSLTDYSDKACGLGFDSEYCFYNAPRWRSEIRSVRAVCK